MATPHTISLLVKVVDEREGTLNGSATPITPGMLVEKVTTFTERPALRPQATAAAAIDTVTVSPMMVAIESPQRAASTNLGSTIDTAYNVTGEAVPYIIPLRGDHLYMFLEDEGNVAAGALLEAAGDGSLQAVTTGKALARALEAVNNTGGTGMVRIRVEVL